MQSELMEITKDSNTESEGGITSSYAADDGVVLKVPHSFGEGGMITTSRDEFKRILYREEGIRGILHYQPTYDFTGWKRMGYQQHLCPRAEDFFYRRELNLPMNPRLTAQQIEDMVTGIRRAAEKVQRGKQ